MELIMLGRKLHGGTFKTKESRVGLVWVPLFWESHWVTCVPARLIPYHVTGLCKGPITSLFVFVVVSPSCDAKNIVLSFHTSSSLTVLVNGTEIGHVSMASFALRISMHNRISPEGVGQSFRYVAMFDWQRFTLFCYCCEAQKLV